MLFRGLFEWKEALIGRVLSCLAPSRGTILGLLDRGTCQGLHEVIDKLPGFESRIPYSIKKNGEVK